MNHSPFKKTTCLLLAILMTLSAASPALADLFAFVPVESKTAWSDGVLTAGAGGYAVNVTYGADAGKYHVRMNVACPRSAVLDGLERLEKAVRDVI